MSFTKKIAALTMAASVAICGACPAFAADYTDVSESDWFYESVKYSEEKDLISGISDTEFATDTPMTRSMLVTALWKNAGSPEPESMADFKDMPAGEWNARAVSWSVEHGIVTGITNESFDPDGKVTREQLAVILYRYAGSLGIETPAEGMAVREFSDYESISTWASEAVRWAVGHGIIAGDGGRLNPQGDTTRAEAAKMLMSYFENIAAK